MLKLLYLFVIGPLFFPVKLCITNDTFSYTLSFINLVEKGTYSHDPGFESASYGRLPTVGFAWGIFYLLFGLTSSYKAFAVFQILLDLFAASCVYRLIEKFFHRKAAIVSTLVYVLFPLITYYVVKTGVEYLTVFFTITVVYSLVFYKPDVKHSVLLALQLVLGLFVKETLLLLFPLSFLYLIRNHSVPLKQYAIIFFTAMILYLPWPVRNYIHSGTMVFTKPVSAGYRGYSNDMLNYMYWMYAWHDADMLGYFNKMYVDSAELNFPKEIFSSSAEERLAYNLVKLARRCGTSFVYWKQIKGLPLPEVSCNEDQLIGRGFDLLRRNYAKAHPFNYYIKIPLQNLSTAFFKSSLTEPQSNIEGLFRWVMGLRSLLLITGLIACMVFRRSDLFVLSFVFFWVYYIFICGVFRNLEMRYILPADVLMIVIASGWLGSFLPKEKINFSSER